jgi:hypothetical protein
MGQEQQDGAAGWIDPVEEAGEESFPASDAPAWTPMTAIGPPSRRRADVPEVRGELTNHAAGLQRSFRRTEPMASLETLRRSVTDAVAEWLLDLIEARPDIAPTRADPTADDPAAVGWLHRFVRDVVTVDPETGDDLTNIQIFLIEFALDCVDWDSLARDTRFRHLDWSRARLTAP